MSILDQPGALDEHLSSEQLADERHRRIARDSLILTASYGATALVGVAFWTLAARTIPPAQLGIETAVISAFTAAATIAAGGVANAFLAMLPIAGTSRRSLLRLGYVTVISAALVCGLIAGVFTELLLPQVGSPLWTITGVTAAAVLWSLFVVQDPVLTAFGKASWLLAENLPVNVAKLALLPIFGAVVAAGAKPVVLAMLLPSTVAVLIVTGILVPRLARTARTTNDPALVLTAHRKTFATFVLRDSAAGALNLGLVMLLPFVVTVTSGPVQGAVFALCMQVSSALDLVTAGVGVSLTTNVASSPADGPEAAMRMWRRLSRLVAALSILVIAGSPVLLWFFGPTYLAHNGVLVISVLAAGALMRTPFEVWTALLRAQRRVGTLLAWTAFNFTVLMGLVITLSVQYGALGAACGVSVAALLSGLVGGRGMRSDLRAVRVTA